MLVDLFQYFVDYQIPAVLLWLLFSTSAVRYPVWWENALEGKVCNTRGKKERETENENFKPNSGAYFYLIQYSSGL